MSCFLRLSGDALPLEAILQALPVAPERIETPLSKARDRISLRKPRPSDTRTSVHVCVHDGDFDPLAEQVASATRFMIAHHSVLLAIMSMKGIEYASLDFGLLVGDVPMFSDRLPPTLLSIAGELGLSINLSHYFSSDK